MNIKKLLSTLSLKEKIAQLIFLDLRNYDLENTSYENINKALNNYGLGGIILFHGKLSKAKSLIRSLKQKANIPLLISSDFERGIGQILQPALEYPHNMAFAATFNIKYIREYAIRVAKESKAIGVNIIYAPVADLNTNPLNPIVNTRSYGDNLYFVSRFVCEYIKGMESSGVMACVKHFPGHGETYEDSHVKLARVDILEDRFYDREFVPFKKAIESGVSGVMCGHLDCPSISKTNMPATFSYEVVTKILKNKLKFDGIVFSDALNMGAILDNFSDEKIAVNCMKAGIDVLIHPESYFKSIEFIENAVKLNLVKEENINVSLGKILNFKKRFDLFNKEIFLIEKQKNIISDDFYYSDNLDFAFNVAKKSITLIEKNDNSFVDDVDYDNFSDYYTWNPLEKSYNINLCFLDEDEVIGRSKKFKKYINDFAYKNKLKLKVNSILDINPSNISKFELSYENPFFNSNIILMPIFSIAKGWKWKNNSKISYNLDSKIIDFVNYYLKKYGNKIILAIFGCPYIANKLNAKFIFLTYSDTEISQKAFINVIFAESKLYGKLPINL